MRTMDLKWVGIGLLSFGIVGCGASQTELTETKGALMEIRGQLASTQDQLRKAQEELRRTQASLALAQQTVTTGSATVEKKPDLLAPASPKTAEAHLSSAPNKKYSHAGQEAAPPEQPLKGREVVSQDPVIKEAQQAVATQNPREALATLERMKKQVADQKRQENYNLIIGSKDSDGNPPDQKVSELNSRYLRLASMVEKQRDIAAKAVDPTSPLPQPDNALVQKQDE